ncbi:MAG: 3-hydroxyacyl-ACP dehydratase FabZ [Peptostreptococcaceae bacterium]|nr:3-hydroxyacyl-ACP dehydratase FabZ [Peptostreptococcaceae bacterium]
MLYNKEEIKNIIPHRDPFLLIDEVESMETGKSIVAIKNVNAAEYYFEGHFPQEKVMPGVLIIEALAQAGAVAILSMDANKGKIAYFGGIKNAKFRQKVVPGDTLRLVVEIDRLRSNAGTGIGTAYVGDKMVCKCELMFAIG